MPVDPDLLAVFKVTTIVALVTPGPDMLFVLGCGKGVVSPAANPQTFTFMVAFLPRFIDPAVGPVRVQFAVLGGVLIVLEFLADGTVGVLAGRIGDWLRERQAARRRIDAATGTVFIGLGVRLAAER